ncbi:hypothetical protein CR205_09885 [Alteribacter lacisalsi]|uniref:YhaN AAA domain-containing protein n=1 Tax=Alteribacter lacisalsi TaxID=2045244 RepID=A0A2W0HD87_9BACI|nr:AAA family ATPase [Alteribacter lacisalsi]PYZ98856.1 hypothetical protein CR205_09885 [Alteribacter lacisalsi]
MIITQIDIYGFGKWQSETFYADEEIKIIYGENEAGKSTMMAFIRAVLFGFPKRADRYRPIGGSDFGGSLTVRFQSAGMVRIERILKRRAKGDVSVYYSDGTTGGEEDLERLLEGMSEQVFTGIFSFDLQGLQGIGKMDAQTLNDYLYDASLSGGPSLLACEKEADKRMQELFKVRGKKTPVNEQLKVIQETEKEVSKREEQAGAYAGLVRKRNEGEEALRELKTEREKLQADLNRWERVSRLAPMYREYTALKESSSPDFAFPHQGKEQLVHLLQTRERLSESLQEIHGWIDELSEKRKKHAPTLSYEQAVRLEEQSARLNKQSGVYEDQAVQMARLEEERSGLNRKKEDIEHDWGWQEDTHNLRGRDTAKASRTEMERLSHEAEKAKSEREAAEKELLQLKGEKTRLNERLTAAKEARLAPETERIYRDRAERLEEYESVKKKIPEWKAQLASFSRKDRGKLLPAAGILLLLFGAAGLLTGDPLTGSASVIIGVLLFIAGLSSGRFQSAGVHQEALKEELDRWERFETEAASWPADEWREALAAHEEAIREHMRLRHLAEDAESRYALAERLLHQSEKQADAVTDALMNWAVKAGFEPSLSLTQYRAAFEDTVKWQEHAGSEKEQIGRIEKLKRDRESFEQLVFSFAEEAGLSRQEGGPLVCLADASRCVRSELEKHRTKKTVEEQEMSALSQKKAFEKQIKETDNGLEELFSKAEVSDAEAFAEKVSAWEDEQRKRDRIKELELEMRAVSPRETRAEDLETCSNWGEMAEEKWKETANRKKETDETWKRTIEEITRVKQEIESLEQGHSLEECLQQFEHEKSRLAEQVEEWAVLAIARDLAARTKMVLEKERQPGVIREAGKLFEQFTAGRYTGLFAPLGEGHFIVERTDKTRFEPSSLSQGTQELLYLSIRFALAFSYGKEERFPIIIDEAFVNFDEDRRTRVMTVLKGLSAGRQILCFTCHRHMIEEQPELSRIDLSVSRRKNPVS